MKTISLYIYTCARGLMLLLLSLTFASAAAQDFEFFTHPSPAPKRELRAVWLTTLNGLDWPQTHATDSASRALQQQELCQLLDRLQAIHINTILLQTRVRGSVIYPSATEPWDGSLTGTIGRDPGYDPLAFAIEQAHRRGMELHAWVVTIPCFKIGVARQMGPKSVLETHPELCRRHADTYYLDPGQPGTADYLSGICQEITRNYDIDGIHFDYIRYPEDARNFNDASTFKKYGEKGQSKATWRQENITRIVRRIYEDVHRLKPWVRISSSPVGKYADVSRFPSRGWNARDAVHQDAQGWLRSGIHDMLFPMMYFDGQHFYPFAADWQEQRCGRLVAPGLGIYFLHPREKDWPLPTIVRQLNYLRSEGLAGQAYFRCQFLTDNVKGIYDYLQRDFYAFPALPPACPWLSATPPPSPADLKVIPRSGSSELRWQVPPTATTSSSPTGNAPLRFNVYASSTWPVDISRAENLVGALLPQPYFRFNTLYAVLSHLYLAVTSIDRYGNESPAAQLSASPDSLHHIPTRLLDSRGRLIDFIRNPQPAATPTHQRAARPDKARE